jgi:uncharacterized membrane protein YeaQ/YmgE (transglycosylase-associated protein family)
MNTLLINLIVWGVIGAVVGLTVGRMFRREQTPIVMVYDVVAGIIGGFAGGALLRLLSVIGDAELSTVLSLPSAAVALVGAVVVAEMADMIWSNR